MTTNSKSNSQGASIANGASFANGNGIACGIHNAANQKGVGYNWELPDNGRTTFWELV